VSALKLKVLKIPAIELHNPDNIIQRINGRRKKCRKICIPCKNWKI